MLLTTRIQTAHSEPLSRLLGEGARNLICKLYEIKKLLL